MQRVQLEFLPSFSLRTHVLSAEIDGKPAKFETFEPVNEVDQHVSMLIPINGERTVVHIRLKDEFGIVYPYVPSSTGAVSSNVKFISEHWNAAHDRLELQVAGAGGAKYRVPLAGDLAGVTVTGAELSEGVLQIEFPAGPSDGYTTKAVALQFPSH